MRFDEHFVLGTLSDVTILENVFPHDVTFSVDTRTLQPGQIFAALSGAQTDGHEFLVQALQKGAAGFLISEEKKSLLKKIDASLLKNKVVIAVRDVFAALTSLAAAWRAQFEYPVVAITGSVGKTSTKQIVANILQLHISNFLVSEGNQNTQLGLALNILRMRAEHGAAIFEVGINGRGQMAQCVAMLKPTTALITGVGHCHMEGLGSLNDIAQEKRDIFKEFSEDSIGIINGDQPVLGGVGYAHPVIKFGSKTTNQIQARKISAKGEKISFVLKIYKKKYNVTLGQTHAGAVFNALGAAVIAHFLNVPDDVIARGIEQPVFVGSRFERCELKNGKGVLIDDCYNANPESMKAALLAFENIETKARKIAVLGDMLELGINSPFWHRQLGRFLRKVPSLRDVILVGEFVEWTKKTLPLGVNAEVVPTWEDAVKKLETKLEKDNVVLVKGSNGMNLNNLVQCFSKKNKQSETTG